jgi:glucose/arabinose dehydrogenase
MNLPTPTGIPERRRAILAGLLAIGLLAAACDGGGATGGPTGRTGATAGGSSDPTTSPSTPSEQPSSPEQALDLDRVELRLRPVAEGFARPLLVTSAGDGSGRLFVVEQEGRIRVIEDGEIATFLDISDRVVAEANEQGFLGLAFHPGFEENGRFFVDYTDLRGDTVVSEFVVSGDGAADPTSERVLLLVDQPFGNHNGGHLAFGPDGYLYVALGDGGSAGDPMGNGQALGALLGKLLRIDVDDEGNGTPYEIPPDNPFVDRAGARPEIWAYGLRNPWRFSFDRETGELWIGDVGQQGLEEVDRAPAGEGGLNFGWNVMEGTACFQPTAGCEEDGLVAPVAEYRHDQGCSITGGYVYRGDRWAALRGAYVFADYCSGLVWGIDADAGDGAEPTLLLDSGLAISSFGEDEAGELYVTDHAGGVVLQVEAFAG